MMTMSAGFNNGRLVLLHNKNDISVYFQDYKTKEKHSIETFKTLQEAEIAFNVRCEAPDKLVPSSYYGTIEKGLKK